MNGMKKTLCVLATLFAVIGGVWAAQHVFATNERVDKLEVRVSGISLAYLQEELDRLEDKYGHTDCIKMNEADKTQCRWVKKTMDMLKGGN